MIQRVATNPRQFLCIGHPRCGTGFTAHVLTAMGWDVGHENMANDGVSSWMLAVDADHYPWGDIADATDLSRYRFHTLIHAVRDPVRAIPSIVLENRCSPGRKSLHFRLLHIERKLGLSLSDIYADTPTPSLRQELLLSAQIFLAWNRICADRNPDITFPIEHGLDRLAQFNRTDWDVAQAASLPRNANKPYQGVVVAKPMEALEDAHWRLFDGTLQHSLRRFRQQHGYETF